MNDSQDNNLLADFCGIRSVLVIAVAMVLLAVVMLLVPGQKLSASWESLGMLAMFLQWLGLLCLAVLCLISRWLKHQSIMLSTIMVFVTIQLVTLVVSEMAYQLTVTVDLISHLKPEQHDMFLLRNAAISIIISGVALRYLYLQKQLQVRITAENQARIQALQARIRPHFLFNSMNTIAALTHVDADAAEKAVLDLSEIYRAILNADDSLTTLESEISLTKYYLEIEQLRLGERLTVEWQLDESLLPVSMPGLVIQPLVENAVYHGIEPRTDGGKVSILIESRDGMEITIRNPLPGKDDDSLRRGNQIALGNICERLKLEYGRKARLDSHQDEQQYMVRIFIPMGGR